MKRALLIAVLLAIPAFAADNANNPNKALPQETQIRLLKGQRQMQQLQMQMSNLQRQYDDAVKQFRDLQGQMGSDCTAAMKDAKLDQEKYTCDLDSLSFVPNTDDKKVAEKK